MPLYTNTSRSLSALAFRSSPALPRTVSAARLPTLRLRQRRTSLARETFDAHNSQIGIVIKHEVDVQLFPNAIIPIVCANFC